MLVQNLVLENYKTFWNEQMIRLAPGFNLLLGANNAGKTSVLEVLDLDLNLSSPHKSARSVPHYGSQPPGASRVGLDLQSDMRELLAVSGGICHLPYMGGEPRSREDLAREALLMLERNEVVSIRMRFGSAKLEAGIEVPPFVSARCSTAEQIAVPGFTISTSTAHAPTVAPSTFQLGAILGQYASAYRQRLYRFNAQRRPGSTSGPASAQLDRDASTLPFCINHLQTVDAHGHRLLCEWVQRIFPSVEWVQAPPSSNTFQIYCLPQKPEARRDDLAVPMSSMGSGIGNVLAILYVVLTARHPQVIAIDEPNAFLHPRALRELLNILSTEGKQHQYVLTAHSADVLTAVSAKTITLLDFDGVITTVREIGSTQIHQLRGALADLGIRLTDLHAKDRVLWVEGQTEELVLPDVLRWACPEIAAGTAVLRVEHTGTFNSKGVRPEEVASLYERLSQSSALVPPMTCILLDGEKVPVKRRAAIEERSGHKLRFLPRRMLENYFLDPRAIVAALKVLGEDIHQEKVELHLKNQLGDSPNLEQVDGASVLVAIFSETTQAKQEFRKTRDVEVMVTYLLEHDPNFLVPLRHDLRKIVGLPT